MADYTGMTVKVELKQPPGIQLFGIVKEVVAGQTLTLYDVFFPSTGQRWEHFTVQGTAIADLQVVQHLPPTAQSPMPPATAQTPSAYAPQAIPSLPPQQFAHHPPPPQAHPAPLAPPSQSQQPRQPSNQFVDPAILSYGKSPTPTEPFAQPPQAPQAPEAPSTPIKSMLQKAAESLPTNTSPFIGEAGKLARAAKAAPVVAAPSPQRPRNQTQPSRSQQVLEEEAPDQQGNGEANGKKKSRRTQKKKAAQSAAVNADPPPVMNVEVSRNGNDMNGAVKRGKGWRQGPFLQPSPQTTSPASGGGGGKKQSRRQREKEDELKNSGWATEDATDIQGLEDFDFEANHKLFDKKTVFEELRQGDTTADEDRLVSHNRLARPGTYGGKNLHPTENVLSPKLAPAQDDGDSTSDADTELNLANGRSSSRHSLTRASLAKKQPSRQNSGMQEARPYTMTASLSSQGINRPPPAAMHRGKSMASVTASDRLQSPHSGSQSFRTAAGSSAPLEPRLAIQRNGSTCPVLHPAALDTLEHETVSRYGLTPEAITESAARSVAEVAMTMFEAADNSRRGSRATTKASMASSLHLDRSAIPVIVILAGNHTLGARAIAAARHLISRKTSIIIAEAVHESAEQQDPQMQTQATIVKRMARAGANIKRGPWRKVSQYIKNLTGPPALIVDALLTGSTYDAFLQANGKDATTVAEVREMIDWANRSRAPVLSVGCPSGVNGIDGTSTLVEGEPLAVRPEKILCLGGPMQGLLEAMKAGERWEVVVADVGINIALRSEEAISFGAAWVVDVRFVDEEGEVTQ